MMRLPSTGWEKMSTFLEIYLICIINACSYGFLVACEHLWHAWNALVRLFQRIYQAPYPPLSPRSGRVFTRGFAPAERAGYVCGGKDGAPS